MIFTHVEDENCTMHKGIEAQPSIVFSRKFETLDNLWVTEEKSTKALGDWVNSLMTKTIFELLTDDVTHFLRNPTMVMFLKTEQDKDSKFMKTFMEAAKLNKKH